MSSTNFTVPKGVKKIDCFCVGGGGGRCTQYSFNSDFSQAAGGGGYTNTVIGASVTPGQQLSVVVGAGGFSSDFGSGSNGVISNDGGISSVGSICSANGGCGNFIKTSNGYYLSYSKNGSDGGSGGAPIEGWWWTESDGYHLRAGKDGSDASSFSSRSGGKGQGTTTRYFGESNGTLYASGGEDYGLKTNGKTDNTSGAANTGNGADAIYYGKNDGGSGVCIIRWGK